MCSSDLTAASDNRRPHDAHPSFAQIIRELSSEEAGVLKWCLSDIQRPMVRIKLMVAANEWQVLQHNLLQWPDLGERTANEIRSRSAFVDNWDRLGLVDTTYTEHVAVRQPFSDPYGWVEQSPGYPAFPKPLDENGQARAFPSVVFDRGVLRVTDFGQRFLRAVR